MFCAVCCSFEDKEETAQWVSAPGTIRSILEAAMGRVSSLKNHSCIVHNKTLYEGTFERVTFLPMAEDGCIICFSSIFLVVDACIFLIKPL